ncbi:hypothetical protein JW998_03750 [candidate division KSB1 bacterium]|nr:hypothetical protein [candidate division KSB1 bacterium]
MKLSNKKQVFVLLSFVFLVGFRLAHLDFNPPDMNPWTDDLNGQFVTPVSTVALFRSDEHAPHYGRKGPGVCGRFGCLYYRHGC